MSEFLFQCTLRATWVVALAIVVAWLLRRRSAALRAAVWTAAVVALLAIPMLPQYEVTVPVSSPLAFASAMRQGQHLADMEVRTAPRKTHRGVDSPIVMPTFSLAQSLFILGFVVVGWKKIRAWLTVTRMVQRSSRARVDALAQEIATDLGLRRIPEIRLAREETVPFTIGAWRPRIVLPASSITWEPGRMDMVLRHEMAHVERGDWAVLLIAQVAQVAFWFHPFVWFGVARLRFECEQAADDAVLASSFRASDYASELRAWSLRSAPEFSLPVARPSGIAQRLRRILDGNADRRRASTRSRVAFVGFLLICAIPVFGGAPGPARINFPDGSKVTVRRISTWDAEHGYVAWDIDGHRLSVTSDTDEKNIRDAIQQWAQRYEKPAPDARWVAVSLALDENTPDPKLAGVPQLRLTAGEGTVLRSGFMPGPRRKGEAPIFTYVYSVDPNWKCSDAQLDLNTGADLVYAESPLDGNKYRLVSALPPYLRDKSHQEMTFFRGRVDEPESDDWIYFTRVKWSNGATTGPMSVSGEPDGSETIGTETVPNAHIVSIQTMRQRQFKASVRKIPLYPQGAK